jgi:hydrogen cyanide synthase HcnB
MTRFCKAVVLGAGPAGLAAAVELSRHGIGVTIVDDNPDVGGQIYRQPPEEFIITDETHLIKRHKIGHQLIQELNKLSVKMTIIRNAYTWGLYNSKCLAILHNGEIEHIEFDKLFLCEGALERSIPFSGWTLPGIMTTGGLQKMVTNQGLLPGKRFLLAGSSPLLLSVAASLVSAGAEYVGICEGTSYLDNLRLLLNIFAYKNAFLEFVSLQRKLLGKTVKFYRPYKIVSAEGQEKVRKVTIAKLDENWIHIPGSETQIDIDIVGLGFGFLPHARLARLCGCDHVYDSVQKYWKPITDQFMQSSQPNIYVAGDSSGIGGADVAEIDGRIAGIHAAFEIGNITQREFSDQMKLLLNKKRRINKYVLPLNQIFAPRDGLYHISEDTIVCRCEGITAKEILAGIDLGARNINELKRITRFGMGLCQARTCESIATQLMIQKNISINESGYLSLRPPLSPVQLRTFEITAGTDIDR